LHRVALLSPINQMKQFVKDTMKPREAKREVKQEEKVKESKASSRRKPRVQVKRIDGKLSKQLRVHSSHFQALGDVEPSLAASLIDPNTVYKTKMTFNPSVFSTSVGGVLSGFISVDPTISSYNEFSTWAGLFSEVRIARVSLIVCNVNPHYDAFAAGDIKTSIPIAWDDALNNTTPTSVNAVTDNAHVFYHGLADPSPSMHAVDTQDRGWAVTSATDPGPFAGCTGSWYFYQSGLTGSAPYLQCYLAVEFQWRNRV